MSEEFLNLIRREIERSKANSAQTKPALVTAYDPDRHAIKATLQPEGVETGWFPIATHAIGNGYGLTVGPQIGDQIKVGFDDGDINTPHMMGRVHSDTDRPPKALPGETLLQHSNGGKISLTAAGATVSIGGTTFNIAPSGAVTINAGSNPVNITGAVSFTGPSVQHNGHEIGATHTHTLVTPGSGSSGPPP